jgi:NDP-sugar pyrophosphorylase family protein
VAVETIPRKAVILAAGRGERLRPLTDGLPKTMLPIGGRPLLEHLLALLVVAGVREVAVNLHHRPEAIRSYLGDGSRLGLRVVYSQEEALLGTAGALRRLEPFVDRTFFVLYGDVLSSLDLRRLAEFHRQRGGAVTMALYREKHLARCGVAEVEPGGRIRRFVEKPKGEMGSPWAAAGALVMEPWVLRFIPEGFSDLGSDLFPRLVELGVPIYGYRCCGCFLDIGSPERYRKAQADAARGLVRLLALPDRPAGVSVRHAGLKGGTPACERRPGGVYAAS